MTDKCYCASSFLAFRYIVEDNKDFFDGMEHRKYKQKSDFEKVFVDTAEEIDNALQKTFDKCKNQRLGLLLSGGMDSAILASYMRGADAYTFRFQNGTYQSEELNRAKFFAEFYGLNLHYVDVDFESVMSCLPVVMKSKGAPVHSIEPQIYLAAKQAERDGITMMVIGDGSDYVFGGMDKLLSKDWNFDEFVQRYMYINPKQVLKNPVDVQFHFEKYRKENNKIDFLQLMQEMTIDESYASYENPFHCANMKYVDPYENLKMKSNWDLQKIRNGKSKYLIRELFEKKYPNVPVPEKNPMPRPVDVYFEKWEGPQRDEFLKNLNMDNFSGNQKWLMYCLECFLNEYEKR